MKQTNKYTFQWITSTHKERNKQTNYKLRKTFVFHWLYLCFCNFCHRQRYKKVSHSSTHSIIVLIYLFIGPSGHGAQFISHCVTVPMRLVFFVLFSSYTCLSLLPLLLTLSHSGPFSDDFLNSNNSWPYPNGLCLCVLIADVNENNKKKLISVHWRVMSSLEEEKNCCKQVLSSVSVNKCQ